MCIDNDIKILNELRASKRPIKAYRYHEILSNGLCSPFRGTPINLQTNKLQKSGKMLRPLKAGHTAKGGRYAYRSKDTNWFADCILIEVIIYPEDIIAADEETIVANKMYMTNKSWFEQRKLMGLPINKIYYPGDK